MTLVVMRKPEVVLSGHYEQVVIGDSGREIDAILKGADGVVQNVTGWTASIVGYSSDLPGVYLDVPGVVVSPATGGTFRWGRVGDFLTQLREKPQARFTCRVRWYDAAGLRDSSDEFVIEFVADNTGEDTNMNAAAVQAMIDESVHKKLMTNKWMTLPHVADTDAAMVGFRSVGYTEAQWGGAREVALQFAGANKTYVSGFCNSVDQGTYPRPGLAQAPLFGLPFEYRMLMNSSTQFSTTGEAYQGIMVGGPIRKATPWIGSEQALFDQGSGAFIQLRYNYTRGKWEVAIWRIFDDTGENIVPIEVTDCDLQPTFTPDQFMTELCLRYDPAPAGGSVLRAYLNQELAATITSASLQALYSASSLNGPGFFVTTGSNSASICPDAIFYTGHWWSPSQSEWAPA